MENHHFQWENTINGNFQYLFSHHQRVYPIHNPWKITISSPLKPMERMAIFNSYVTNHQRVPRADDFGPPPKSGRALAWDWSRRRAQRAAPACRRSSGRPSAAPVKLGMNMCKLEKKEETGWNCDHDVMIYVYIYTYVCIYIMLV